jgi:hypothetical protein
MNFPVLYQMPAALIAAIIFLLMLFLNWLGFTFRKRQIKRNIDEVPDGLGPLETSLLGLMALMLAFTFAMAASKFEARRQVIVDEANNIGTAILRCDLYPDSVRRLFLADFQKYVEARIHYYDAGVDPDKIQAALNETGIYSGRIWKRAAYLSEDLDNRVRSLEMIPALNSMIDIVTTRDAGRVAKVPPIILAVLFVLTVIAGFLAGYSNKGKRRNLILLFGFTAMTTVTLYLIMELDRPRRGIINLDAAEQKITDLKTMFSESQ